MAIPSFYHSSLTLQDELVHLDANESAHAVKSRRLRVGQPVRVFNGQGVLGFGALSEVDRRDVTVQIASLEQATRPARAISIAVAVPKGDRQKVMVDMLTQLGIFEIIPLRCERSITKFSANMSEKWSRVAIEACKQSQNPWLPHISDQLSLDQLLSDSARKLVFANADGVSLSDVAQQTSELTVVIGPEGGFSEQEFAKLDHFSIPSISIGSYILRTEAAAVAVASALAG